LGSELEHIPKVTNCDFRWWTLLSC